MDQLSFETRNENFTMNAQATLGDPGMAGIQKLTEEVLVSQAHHLRLQALQGSAQAAALAHEYEAELRHRLRQPAAPVKTESPVKARPTATTPNSAMTGNASADAVTEAISTLLRNLRAVLGMDIALVAEFFEGRRVFRHVDVDPSQPPRLEVGQSARLEDTYCQRVIDGRLPPVMSDTAAFPETHDLAATHKLGICAYLSAPVVLANGEVYGTLCCISHQARSALGCRQVDALRSAAALVAAEIGKSRYVHLER